MPVECHIRLKLIHVLQTQECLMIFLVGVVQTMNNVGRCLDTKFFFLYIIKGVVWMFIGQE